jgi:hypothetical protein
MVAPRRARFRAVLASTLAYTLFAPMAATAAGPAAEAPPAGGTGKPLVKPEDVDPIATGLVMLEVRPEVQAAYAAAEQAVTAGRHDVALAELQYVLTAAPHWAAAYRLRAQVFGRLAALHPPGAAFLRAQAQDLAYVVELESKAFDRAKLEREISELTRRANRAARAEARRRRLRVPAMVLASFSLGAIAAGAFLVGITPSDRPDAPGHRANDIGGIVTLGAGVGMAITAAVLGGLARRQSRRDAAVTTYYELAQRRLEWQAGPALVRGGGGVTFGLRF